MALSINPLEIVKIFRERGIAKKQTVVSYIEAIAADVMGYGRGVKSHPYEQGFDLRLVPEKLAEALSLVRPTHRIR
jgi:hypothetical protein